MRECEAQGGEGVCNSWPSGGASCSFALQPLASWDKTGMSGWGVVRVEGGWTEGGQGMFLSSQRVCVCVCLCVGGWHRDHQPGPPDQSWRGMGGVRGGSVWLAEIEELLSVMFQFISGSPISVKSGCNIAQWHIGFIAKKELSKA